MSSKTKSEKNVTLKGNRKRIERSNWDWQGAKRTSLTTRVYTYNIWDRYVYVYVRISTLDQNRYFDKKSKTVLLAQRRNEHG